MQAYLKFKIKTIFEIKQANTDIDTKLSQNNTEY